MLCSKASTFMITFAVIVRFHGNDVLCSDNDTADANDNVVPNLVPGCALGANNVSFYLWNSEVPEGVIIDSNSSKIPIEKGSEFVTIMVHGFTSEANNTNYNNLTMTWLKKNPKMNIISVDWKEGACYGGLSILQLLSYPEAVSNTREVASTIGEFVRILIKNYDIDLKNFGFVGHSLGAHLVGFTGKYLENNGIGKLPWIIALDPAGPGFEARTCENRLCKSDANIVQVFHTSIGTGSLARRGNIDLYFNGGTTQPGCSVIDVNCSHSKSVEYLSQSIWNSTKFLAKKWTRFFPRPTFDNCTEETCTIPGLLGLELPARGTFWVDVSTSN